MPEAQHIPSIIMMPGTKFIVSERTKDGVFGPGTTGFVAYVKGPDRKFPNVVHYKVVIIRRGRGGKERLELGRLSTPIFDLNLEVAAKTLPEETLKYFVRVNSLFSEINNVIDFSKIDFLGWATAYTLFIKKLCTRSKDYQAWPNGPQHPLIDGYHLPKYYENDAASTRDAFTGSELRRAMVLSFRKVESSLARCELAYRTKIVEMETGAIKKVHEAVKNADTQKALSFRTVRLIKMERLLSAFGSPKKMQEAHKGDILKEVNGLWTV